METQSWRRDDYEVSTDADRLDVEAIRSFLARSYWAEGIPLKVVTEACANSLCFGLYHLARRDPQQEQLVGFARVITDYATFGYLADVFVLEPHRGVGLSKWLIGCVMEHSELQGLRRWMLATRDAHTLYERYGFGRLAVPAKFMEISKPGKYLEVSRG
jgi:GNAT superfamily N-acetyltransferase